MTPARAMFEGGPAHAKALALERCPIFLRAVVGSDGTVDALDMPDDIVRDGESVSVYILKAEPSVAFVDGRDKQGRRIGWRETMARYAWLSEEVEAAILRDNARWQAWVRENAERLLPTWAKGRVER